MSTTSSTSTFFAPVTLPMSSPTPSDDSSQPSRKRQRTESASEDRKEARAHRNRIAAQNSRDRRKAQFSYLENRVKDLEEENRRLRAGVAPVPAPVIPAQNLERDRENEELRERIKTLEAGWDAVVKALAAQGLSTGLLAPSSAPAPPSSSSESIPPPQSVKTTTPTPPTPAMTVVPAFPLSPAPTTPASIADFDDLSTSPESSMLGLSNTPVFSSVDLEPTRHLAAGGFYSSIGDEPTFDNLAPVEAPIPAFDNAAVESLLKEILTPAALSSSEEMMGAGLDDGLLSFGQGGWSHEEELQMQMYLSLQPDSTEHPSVGVF